MQDIFEKVHHFRKQNSYKKSKSKLIAAQSRQKQFLYTVLATL